MKKIALIMDGWKRFFTYAWPAGILQKIREKKEEINLYIFNSSGSWSLDENYNIGEYNIYRLPCLSDFDGIILDLNNIRTASASEYIVRAARESQKPVIVIGCEIEGFYFVGIDNYHAMREMIAHLHKVHACQSFWFVMADMGNYENVLRITGMKDYMKEQNLVYDEADFYCDSFEFRCGYEGFFTLLLRHDGKLPDAVLCANDNIAVGFCEAAATMGYHAPDDFRITGFDDFDKASMYKPYLSTVNYIREEVGALCAEMLLKIWAGEEIGRFHYTRTKSIFSESCGCVPQRVVDHRQNAKDQIIYKLGDEKFSEKIRVLEYELMHCPTIRDMAECIQHCFDIMQCDAVYLVLDDHMNDFRREREYFDEHLLEDEDFCVEGYPAHMNVEFAYGKEGALDSCGRQIKELFPMFDFDEPATDFVFMPLHFQKYTVGYFVIRNGIYVMEHQYLYEILNTLITAMENLHRKERTEYMNKVLSELYIKDAMTGLYNRMGYKTLVPRMFEEKKKLGENLIVMFIDMDRLKFINDTYGHEYGDFAIRTIAGTLLHYVPKGGVAVRNGGDEFVAILPSVPEEELRALVENIHGEIRDMAERMELPFELSASIGTIYTDWKSSKTMDDYIRQADEIMYKEKMKKKVNRRS